VQVKLPSVLDAAARVGDARRAACNRKENMAIDEPVSDTSRAIQHDPDQTWPASVVLQVTWIVDGHYRTRTGIISSEQFYGRGVYGAPISGDALIMMIEHMRRAGPPDPPKTGKMTDAKSKNIPRGKRRPQGRDVADPKSDAVRVKR